MKRKAVFSIVLPGLLLLLATAAAAQEAAKPRFWVVYTEVVKPSRLMEYEAATKEMTGVMRATNMDSPLVRFTGLEINGFEYVYVIPLDNMAGLESMHTEWMKLQDKIGKAKWMEMARRGGQNLEFYRHSLVMERPDMSYTPANPRLKPEERTFVHYSFFYIIPGRENDVEELAKQYIELFRKKSITEPFTVYQAMFGDELPLFIVASPARNMADWVTQDQKVTEALGSEGRALQMKAMSITRRLEERNGRLRLDLSYPPPAPPTASK